MQVLMGGRLFLAIPSWSPTLSTQEVSKSAPEMGGLLLVPTKEISKEYSHIPWISRCFELEESRALLLSRP